MRSSLMIIIWLFLALPTDNEFPSPSHVNSVLALLKQSSLTLSYPSLSRRYNKTVSTDKHAADPEGGRALSTVCCGLLMGIWVVGRQLTHSQAAWRWNVACCWSSGERSSLPTSVQHVGCNDHDIHVVWHRATSRTLAYLACLRCWAPCYLTFTCSRGHF